MAVFIVVVFVMVVFAAVFVFIIILIIRKEVSIQNPFDVVLRPKFFLLEGVIDWLENTDIEVSFRQTLLTHKDNH